MKPDAGVAATRPEIHPEHQPTMDHFRASLQSSSTHVTAANIAVRLEFQQAIVALRFAPKELPPLNPNHPNHNRMVPSRTNDTLCGRKFNIIFSCRRPRTIEYARADMPEPISTGPPPA
jgi:hypothetical protein